MRAATMAFFATFLCSNAHAQEARDEYINSAGYRLHLRVFNPGAVRSTPTIVLESGGGFASTQWEELQPELATKLNAVVVAYDRPGFGSSDLPDGPYDIRGEVTGLRGALNELSLADHVVLVGHSYGGLPVQLYASMWPDTVSGIVLLDPNSPAAMIALSELIVQPPPTKAPVTQREKALSSHRRRDMGNLRNCL